MSQREFTALLLAVILIFAFLAALAFGPEPQEVCPLCDRLHDGGAADRALGAWHYLLSLPFQLIEKTGKLFSPAGTEQTFPFQ